MVELFKQWFLEIRDNAIEIKKEKARNKGDESKWINEIWTSPNKNKDIKVRFCDEGDMLGYWSRPSYKSKAGEWLYDFSWREFDEHDNLKRIILSMEIEVSDRHFKYDFNKLLQSDSKYKIMVFQVNSESEVKEVFTSLKSAAEAYQSKVQAHYLLVGWNTSKNEFIFNDFRIEIFK